MGKRHPIITSKHPLQREVLQAQEQEGELLDHS